MTRDDETNQISRRTVLRKGATTAGVLAVGGAAASDSAAGATITSAGTAGKRGGRAQVDGTVRRNAPFTVTVEGTEMRNASCMADESALQTYVTYTIHYCDSDDDSDGTLYMLPEEAELVTTETFEIHAVTPCRASDLSQVAIGPSDEQCDGN